MLAQDPTRQDRPGNLAASDPERDRLERLIEVGRQLVSERDLDALLGRILDAARELTAARYAALGVLDQSRTALERFLARGIDETTSARIGDLPRGRGILGELIRDPKPLRLPNLGAHPRSFGFPPAHPEMRSFLGVPIVVRGEAFGNIYLTEKSGSEEFTEADERILLSLAAFAATAVDNARLYSSLNERSAELERAVAALSSNVEMARAVDGEIDLGRVLELIAKRGRATVDARTFLVLLPAGPDVLHVAEAAGERADRLRGAEVATEGTLPGEVIRTGRSERVDDLASRVRGGLTGLDHDASSALLVPLVFRGTPQGALVALDRLDGTTAFRPDQETVLGSFAASAGTALERAQLIEAESLHRSIDSAEGERGRWARELHDTTLQDLGALKLLLEAAGQGDSERTAAAVREAVGRIDGAIEDLQRIITDLRPAALDELGVAPALETLVERLIDASALEVDVHVNLAYDSGRSEQRLSPKVEEVIYRLVQEALNNVVKHAGARRVWVSIDEIEDEIEIVVRDDGKGFGPDVDQGFGLVGMRERASLVNGRVRIESEPGKGTTVSARLPVPLTPGGERSAPSAAEVAARRAEAG